MATLTTSYQRIATGSSKTFGSATGYLELWAKYNSQSTPNNTTNYSVELRLVVTGGYIGNYQSTPWSIGGNISNSGDIGSGSHRSQTLGNATGTVTHNTNGTKSVSMSGSFNATAWGISLDVSGSADLPTIPRYLTVSQSLRSRSINSISINWSTSNPRDWTQYSLNGGSWQDAGDVVSGDNKSGYYTISGLKPNTTYSIRTRCRRTDSGLWSETSSMNVTTYNYATITSAPNFNDEENPTITYSNPFGNSVTTLEAYIALGSTYLTGYKYPDKNGSSYTFNLTDDERKTIRENIKNNPSAQVRFVLYTGAGGSSYWSEVTKTLTIVNANPIFNDFEWETTNYSELTGNNSTIIKGYSNVRTIISDNNKATALKEATLSKYQTNIGSKSSYTTNLTYPTQYDIEKVDGASIQVFAIDSRGNSTAITKPFTNYLEYVPMSNSPLFAERTQQVNSEVNIKFEGEVDLINFGNVTNSIKTAKCYYKETSSEEDFIESGDLTPTLTLIDGTKHKFEIDENIVGDLGANGFDINKSFYIKVVVEDELSRVEDIFTLGSGSPAVAMYKNCVSLGAPYDEELGGRVQINGEIYKNSPGSSGVILYDNSSGTDGTVTLSESSENFEYLEIFFRDKNYCYNSCKIYNANEKKASLIVIYNYSSVYQSIRTVSISGTSITTLYDRGVSIMGSASTAMINSITTYIYITRVIGYR